MELMEKQELIFALDIGTRTVIGLVAAVKDNDLTLLCEEVREHPGRAMFDGQIHDIPQVAAVVAEVKKALENKVGRTLDKVAVAAAGRSLHTDRVSVVQEIDQNSEIDKTFVRGVEMEALREAHRRLDECPEMKDRYYCVGHTVLGYSLDGYWLANLLGHRGSVIGCEVIATFLPGSVVNGLYAVLERCGLEPVNLTLEPIAAIDVAIPDNFRLLNLALVDMGAGTSDLAISRDGNIMAYGMVPVAGDEITEAVVDMYLVDFNTAEGIKRKISEGRDIQFADIVGVEHAVTSEELLEKIEPALDKLAGELAGNILELNDGEPPRSVFCVGGGTRIPTFTDRLARCLGISPQRVVLRDRSNLPNVKLSDEENGLAVTGPEGITVAGIASVAAKRMGFDFMSVLINGREYRLFNTRTLSVSDVLGLIQFNPRDLIGRNGKDLSFTLNGERKVVFGEFARHAEIEINGKPANLQSIVRDGDEIYVVKAQNGWDARGTVGDYLPQEQGATVFLHGSKETLAPAGLVNGEPVSPGHEITPGDNVVIKLPRTVAHLLEMRGIERRTVIVNVNGEQVGLSHVLKDGDRVSWHIPEAGEEKPDLGHDCATETGENPVDQGITVRVNGEEIILTKPNPIFIDIFRHIDFNDSHTQGVPVLKLNGEKAKYTDPLSSGDEVEVSFQKGSR